MLLLRQRGRMSAAVLARELEVSTRTVIRDIEALSVAGVPVYAEQGRGGGYALLPGFRTELTGLTNHEALALLVAGSRRGADTLGLDSSLASAMLKVIDALPDDHRATAAEVKRRLLIEPDIDLLARPTTCDDVPREILAAIRRAVLFGRKIRMCYAPQAGSASWRIVDPIGLVIVRGRSYLLANREGAERSYRLSRMSAAEVLDEPAARSPSVDLHRTWQDRSFRFRHGGDRITVRVLFDPPCRDELLATALAVTEEGTTRDGRLCVEATFQDTRHAEWVLWRLGTGVEVLSPQRLRTELRRRALSMVRIYGGDDDGCVVPP